MTRGFEPESSMQQIRAALTLILILIAGATLACRRTIPGNGSKGPQRRLVLICFDTVRYDSFWLPGKTSPPDEMSRWAERAIRFTQVQSVAPWTIPSVSTVMTGLYPIQHGAGAFSGPVANLDGHVPTPLDKDIPTLADRFVDLSVPTRAVVAQPFFRPKFGLGNGFPRIDFRKHGRVIIEVAEDWLGKLVSRQPDSSFFLYLHFMEAHRVRRRNKKELVDILSRTPAGLLATARAAAPAGICRDSKAARCERYKAYVHAIAQQRAYLAQFLDFLASRNLLQSTTVVLYSDHGEEFHDHLEQERRFGFDPRHLYGVGHGNSLYQVLLHVPVLIWRPGVRGHEVSHLVSLVEFPHLLSRWFQLSLPKLPGIDAMQTAQEGKPSQPLFSSGIAFGPPGFAVRLGSWKLIEYPAQGASWLFDLARDPGEKHPVTDPLLERTLSALIAGYRDLPAHKASPPPQLDRKELEQLKSLGYLTEVSNPR